MTIQYSTAVRNGMLDSIEATVGTSPRLKFYTGTVPANCAASATGTLVADLALPADWLSAASGGVKALLGTWSGAASADGTPGYYRITDSGSTACHEQGTVTATGGGGDLTLDDVSLVTSQAVTITGYSRTAPNP